MGTSVVTNGWMQHADEWLEGSYKRRLSRAGVTADTDSDFKAVTIALSFFG